MNFLTTLITVGLALFIIVFAIPIIKNQFLKPFGDKLSQRYRFFDLLYSELTFTTPFILEVYLLTFSKFSDFKHPGILVLMLIGAFVIRDGAELILIMKNKNWEDVGWFKYILFVLFIAYLVAFVFVN